MILHWQYGDKKNEMSISELFEVLRTEQWKLEKQN